MTAGELLERVADAGAELRLDDGVMKLYAPEPFPADLSAAKPQLLEHLARWNVAEAIRLEIAADDTVSRLGVDGRHPSIQEPAARAVASACGRTSPAWRPLLLTSKPPQRGWPGRSRPADPGDVGRPARTATVTGSRRDRDHPCTGPEPTAGGWRDHAAVEARRPQRVAPVRRVPVAPGRGAGPRRSGGLLALGRP